MEETTQKKKGLQWHPAFFAEIQIELEDYLGDLIFENEHQLSKKPMEIDVLVIKKEKDFPVRKNIGRIFRKHNIIEYKSPEDYLSIDDYYKVYGYACFYKADTGKTDEIKADEITITLVSARYPSKLIKHLQKKRGYRVKKQESGIYYVEGDYFPIQILVTGRLSEEENFWLRSLTNRLEGTEAAQKLLDQYEKHKNNDLYKAVMNVVVQANRETFEEAKNMCDALLELMKDELDEAREDGIQAGRGAGIQETLLELLSMAGKVPDDVAKMIQEEKDIHILKSYIPKAAMAKSAEEFKMMIM